MKNHYYDQMFDTQLILDYQVQRAPKHVHTLRKTINQKHKNI